MRRFFTVGFIVAFLLPTSLYAKGTTTRITITDTSLGTSIDITDRTVVARFNVWDGRGTFSTVNGRETEGSEGFIIDWLAGAVTSRPGGLRRYEVTFYVRYPNASAEQLAYLALYEHDVSSGAGFVYLPGRADEPYRLNVQAISRGDAYEGHWFRASGTWQEVVEPLFRRR